MKLNPESLESIFVNDRLLQGLKNMPPEERIRILEEMDAEEEATTDPATRRAIEAEHQVFRMILRACN